MQAELTHPPLATAASAALSRWPLPESSSSAAPAPSASLRSLESTQSTTRRFSPFPFAVLKPTQATTRRFFAILLHSRKSNALQFAVLSFLPILSRSHPPPQTLAGVTTSHRTPARKAHARSLRKHCQKSTRKLTIESIAQSFSSLEWSLVGSAVCRILLRRLLSAVFFFAILSSAVFFSFVRT